MDTASRGIGTVHTSDTEGLDGPLRHSWDWAVSRPCHSPIRTHPRHSGEFCHIYDTTRYLPGTSQVPRPYWANLQESGFSNGSFYQTNPPVHPSMDQVSLPRWRRFCGFHWSIALSIGFQNAHVDLQTSRLYTNYSISPLFV